MEKVTNLTAKISAVILALIQAFAGFGELPSWADAQGVNLLSSAVLSVAAVVIHVIGKPPAA